jgi:hypothetical protein
MSQKNVQLLWQKSWRSHNLQKSSVFNPWESSVFVQKRSVSLSVPFYRSKRLRVLWKKIHLLQHIVGLDEENYRQARDENKTKTRRVLWMFLAKISSAPSSEKRQGAREDWQTYQKGHEQTLQET